MIIFDLDGTLADCEHRRHFVDPSKNSKAWKYSDEEWYYLDKYGSPCRDKKWKPNWKAFYEACDQDKPIEQTIQTLWSLQNYDFDIEIWSGRCESVRLKTEYWINTHIAPLSWNYTKLKMRPIGDNTPDDQLKEMWLHDAIILEGKTIDFVFDDRPKVIRMWRRHDIFVFNCCQHDEEF